MAAFQVITYGRIWVFTEVDEKVAGQVVNDHHRYGHEPESVDLWDETGGCGLSGQLRENSVAQPVDSRH